MTQIQGPDTDENSEVNMAPNLYEMHSEKLSPEALGHGVSPVAKYKILLAHIMDLFAVCMTTVLINALLDTQFGQFVMTKNLQLAWKKTSSDPTTLITLSVVFAGYFFFSFFFNQGQTWGMHQMKIRYPMKGHDFRASFQRMLSSTALYFSMGLLIGSIQKFFSRQDHLYHSLIQPRELPARSLVEAIELYHASEEAELTQVKEAA